MVKCKALQRSSSSVSLISVTATCLFPLLNRTFHIAQGTNSRLFPLKSAYFLLSMCSELAQEHALLHLPTPLVFSSSPASEEGLSEYSFTECEDPYTVSMTGFCPPTLMLMMAFPHSSSAVTVLNSILEEEEDDNDLRYDQTAER